MKGHESLATARNNIVFSKGNYDNGKPFFDFACRTGIRAYGSRRPAGFDDERDAFSTVLCDTSPIATFRRRILSSQV